MDSRERIEALSSAGASRWINRDECSRDEWLKVLEEYNRQRPKTDSERIRENMVRRPAGSYFDLHAPPVFTENAGIELTSRNTIHRSIFSPRLMPFVKTVLDVMNEHRTVWGQITLRWLHYRLVSMNPRPMFNSSNGGQRSQYDNTERFYRKLSNVVTRMRVHDYLPMWCLIDETRDQLLYATTDTLAEYIGGVRDRLASHYWHNLLIIGSYRSDPGKADAETRCRVRCAAIPDAAGYRPWPMLHSASGRCGEAWKDSGKDRLVLLILG